MNDDYDRLVEKVAGILTRVVYRGIDRNNRLEEFLKPGDVIGVTRGIYEHYGIYAGNGKVIHYAAENGDFGTEVAIREADLERFADGDDDVFIVSFAPGGYPLKIHLRQPILNDIFETIKECAEEAGGASFHFPTVYSPEETLRRARSRIGESRYSLLNNNCEHFAIWAKTGQNTSMQVERARKGVWELSNLV